MISSTHIYFTTLGATITGQVVVCRPCCFFALVVTKMSISSACQHIRELQLTHPTQYRMNEHSEMTSLVDKYACASQLYGQVYDIH